MQYQHHPAPRRHERFEQFYLILRDLHIRAVDPLRFRIFVQPRKKQRHVRLRGKPLRFAEQFFVVLSVSLEAAAEENRGKTALFQFLRSRCQHDRIHDGRPRSLIPRTEGKIADHRDALPPAQRQRSVVFQQHRALFRRLFRQFVMRFFIEVFNLFLLRKFRKRQQPLYAFVQKTLFDLPLFQRRKYVLHAVPASRHLQFVAAFQTRHAVVAPRPIRYHYPSEPPFSPKDIFHQMRVFIGINSVQFVVRGHHAFRPAFPDGDFKTLQIQFAQGAFVHDRIARHPTILAVVRRKVLYARRHVFALDPAHVCRRHFSRQVRIFRIIFEIPPAERIALDVQPRAQQYVHVHRRGFFTQRFPDPFAQLFLPRTRRRRRRRKTRRRQ